MPLFSPQNFRGTLESRVLWYSLRTATTLRAPIFTQLILPVDLPGGGRPCQGTDMWMEKGRQSMTGGGKRRRRRRLALAPTNLTPVIVHNSKPFDAGRPPHLCMKKATLLVAIVAGCQSTGQKCAAAGTIHTAWTKRGPCFLP